ncbi:hypothetical protein D7V80_21055 [Corallococcus sp. CA054B]|uniref:hypothetical protein n=1 Tax=Corallococcus sp. CA054B TaxID=2316734 RepID=UPI000EA23CBA|nr:hypothetical protein [Corallococcus sp. CA054B]RKG66081.1 hypothetical protein D7V80_21055 [Corallococcus sp. CA054B]
MYTHAVLVPFKVNPKDEGHADALSIAKGLHERIRKHPYKLQNKTRRLYKMSSPAPYAVVNLPCGTRGLSQTQTPPSRPPTR